MVIQVTITACESVAYMVQATITACEAALAYGPDFKKLWQQKFVAI